MTTNCVMIVASFPESVIKFRGPLIADMLKAGARVVVAVPGLGRDSMLRTELADLGVDAYEIPLGRTGTNPLTDLALLASLYFRMRQVRPTAVLSYTAKPVIYGSIAAWLARVPCRYALITGVGYAFTGERRGLLTKLVRFLYRISLARIGKAFFQNPDDERMFRELGLLPSRTPSVVVNGSGVDLNSFAFAALPPGEPVFLMIGRLLGDKGVREYSEAAGRVKAKYPDARFQLAGWIDTNPDAIAATELDGWVKTGVVEYLGKLEDVRPAISGSTVYVLPSYREGTPRTVLEAMAMGRPIITTDAPGCRETVVDGDNGFLVPVQSVDGLVAAMIRFIENPGLAGRMGMRSRQVAEGKYDVNEINAVMLREMCVVPAANEGAKNVA